MKALEKLMDISLFIGEDFKENEMQEIRGGGDFDTPDVVNNGTGCGCPTTTVNNGTGCKCN